MALSFFSSDVQIFVPGYATAQSEVQVLMLASGKSGPAIEKSILAIEGQWARVLHSSSTSDIANSHFLKLDSC